MAKGERLDAIAALMRARALIADSERWCRSAPARYCRQGRGRGKGQHKGEWLPTHSTDPRAERWCAAGALCKVSGVRSGAPGFALLDAAAVRLFGVGIGRANDDPRNGHADVLRCFDEAIAASLRGTA